MTDRARALLEKVLKHFNGGVFYNTGADDLEAEIQVYLFETPPEPVNLVGPTFQVAVTQAVFHGLRVTHPCGAPIEASDIAPHGQGCQCQNDE